MSGLLWGEWKSCVFQMRKEGQMQGRAGASCSVQSLDLEHEMSCSEVCGKSDVSEGKVVISNLSRVRPREILGTVICNPLSVEDNHSFWSCRRSSLPGLVMQQAALLPPSSDLVVTALPTTSATWVRLSGLWKSRCEVPDVSQHEPTSCLLRCSSEIQEEVGRCLKTPPSWGKVWWSAALGSSRKSKWLWDLEYTWADWWLCKDLPNGLCS